MIWKKNQLDPTSLRIESNQVQSNQIGADWSSTPLPIKMGGKGGGLNRFILLLFRSLLEEGATLHVTHTHSPDNVLKGDQHYVERTSSFPFKPHISLLHTPPLPSSSPLTSHRHPTVSGNRHKSGSGAGDICCVEDLLFLWAVGPTWFFSSTLMVLTGRWQPGDRCSFAYEWIGDLGWRGQGLCGLFPIDGGRSADQRCGYY